MTMTAMRALSLALVACTAGAGAAACPAHWPAQDIAIYPTAETVPANLLRAYIYFPRAMNPVGMFDHIALRDDAGTDLRGVFLPSRYELWSPDRRRLTVLFDPGRVKTGLSAHDALGRALDEGERYSLVLLGDATDAEGCPIGSDTTYEFLAGPADLDPPLPEAWGLARPAAGTTDAFEVDLGSSHDHLSLALRLRVLTDDGTVVRGRIDLGDGERVWRFLPAQPWAAAPHVLAIDARLEDLAGNRPGSLFDQPIEADRRAVTTELPWTPISAN